MQALADTRMSVDEFLAWLELQDAKYELYEGRVVAMAGGTVLHGRVARRILAALDRKLADTGCEAFGGDVAVRTGPETTRLPDAAIYCDPLDIAGDVSTRQVLSRPKVIFEVLSPSTAGHDRATKMIEYRSIASTKVIVLVQPVSRQLDVHERISDTEWRSVTHLRGAALELSDPALTLTSEEIFGLDEAYT